MFLHLQRLRHRTHLQHRADTRPRSCITRIAAKDPRRTSRRRRKPQQQPHRRRLARAVRPQQSHNLTGSQCQRQSIQGRDRPILLSHVIQHRDRRRNSCRLNRLNVHQVHNHRSTPWANLNCLHQGVSRSRIRIISAACQQSQMTLVIPLENRQSYIQSVPYCTGICVNAIRVGAVSRAGSIPAKCRVECPYLRFNLSIVADS